MSTKQAVPTDTIGNRLILARAMAGHLSIREAAMRCGLGRGAWQNWERGGQPPVGAVVAIAKHLDVDFDWLARGGALAAPPISPGAAGAQRTITRTTRGFGGDSHVPLYRELIAA